MSDEERVMAQQKQLVTVGLVLAVIGLVMRRGSLIITGIVIACFGLVRIYIIKKLIKRDE
ncbi:hypothetical protein [Catenisphaera adipataccumulans]|jgi:hypothetical protein|uniref:Uncharacterized protein n=1 Tax=Catenisphaera adipataccumulans TaxID=700500 RepID=A0A7W8CWT0_9FIRM|nr:hypothetical protein [Catenisphaera adipataccumulans]MBB5182414.1 hypothetical protein [Catenisphaera adipataccumulans]